jgi:lysozyme
VNISQNGLDFLKRWEGVRRRVYLDSVRKPTVGVGHLILPEDNLKVGDVINEEDVDRFLRQDVRIAETAVNALNQPLTQNQFDALVSFTFNLGWGGLKKLVRNGLAAVPNRILLFDHAGGKQIKGLTRRRAAERALFLTP